MLPARAGKTESRFGDSTAMFNITDIRITKIEGDEKLRAFAAIVLDDCFLIGDLRVVEGEEGYFVSMPSKRKRDGSFKDIAYPLNNEVRELIEKQVLLAYESATGARAISRIETGEATTVRPDLLGVGEFGFTPKANP
jgi:stage V sporulation protein G